MEGKVLFSQVCVCPHGGVHQSQVLSQVTGPMSFPGGTPVPGSFPGHWSQVTGPRSFLGVPHPDQGVPQSWQDGVPPLARSRWGTPPTSQVRMGYLCPGQDLGPPPPPPEQNNRASTCYATGGMPLAFTQEDCLVYIDVFVSIRQTSRTSRCGTLE